MSKIKGKDTGPELRLRRALWASGLRFRLRQVLPGKPDLVFPKARLAVFVDGCFWHGCPQHWTKPKANSEFWQGKIEANRDRDERVDEQLSSDGWQVMRFWEHELKSCIDAVVGRISDAVYAATHGVGKDTSSEQSKT